MEHARTLLFLLMILSIAVSGCTVQGPGQISASDVPSIENAAVKFVDEDEVEKAYEFGFTLAGFTDRPVIKNCTITCRILDRENRTMFSRDTFLNATDLQAGAPAYVIKVLLSDILLSDSTHNRAYIIYTDDDLALCRELPIDTPLMSLDPFVNESDREYLVVSKQYGRPIVKDYIEVTLVRAGLYAHPVYDEGQDRVVTVPAIRADIIVKNQISKDAGMSTFKAYLEKQYYDEHYNTSYVKIGPLDVVRNSEIDIDMVALGEEWVGSYLFPYMKDTDAKHTRLIVVTTTQSGSIIGPANYYWFELDPSVIA